MIVRPLARFTTDLPDEIIVGNGSGEDPDQPGGRPVTDALAEMFRRIGCKCSPALFECAGPK